jgi:hypothetical protein
LTGLLKDVIIGTNGQVKEEKAVPQSANQEIPSEEALSRRRLLKALAATGGAVAAANLLPGQWVKPVVEVGVLPAHAQVTPIQGPIATIIGCFTFNIEDPSLPIAPFDTIETYAQIAPALSGIQMRRTITLNQAGHPQNGVVDTTTGPTDATGLFQPADFALGTLSPLISPGVGRLTVLWEFVNPADGTNTCQNNVDIFLT